MRFRDWIWLAVVLAMGCGWWRHSWGLWIGKAMAEDKMRLCNDEIKRLRTELADVKPDKIYPQPPFSN